MYFSSAMSREQFFTASIGRLNDFRFVHEQEEAFRYTTDHIESRSETRHYYGKMERKFKKKRG